jgi:hypothetical protein
MGGFGSGRRRIVKAALVHLDVENESERVIVPSRPRPKTRSPTSRTCKKTR